MTVVGASATLSTSKGVVQRTVANTPDSKRGGLAPPRRSWWENARYIAPTSL
jgi:hypothetical protein